MGFRIDIDEVRQIKRKIAELSEEADSLSARNAAFLRDFVNDNMMGLTADALTEELSALSGDMRKISSALDTVQAALAAYIRKIEETDEEISRYIKNT